MFFVETVTWLYEAVPQSCGFWPALVTSHAIGIGVICDSSLYVYQLEFADVLRWNVTVSPLAVTSARSSGIVPAA